MTASVSGASAAATSSTQNAGATGTASTSSEALISSTIGSMADLQAQSPEVYNAMMQGIAMNICNEMAREQAHLKQIQDEFRRESEG